MRNKTDLIKEYKQKEHITSPTLKEERLIGRLRLAIKKDLSEEIKEIDKLVKKVVG